MAELVSLNIRKLPEKVRRAIKIARVLQADPDQADRILERESLSREEFEAMLYGIAADPEPGRLYNAAMAAER